MALAGLIALALGLDGPLRAGGLLPAVLAEHNPDALPGELGLRDEACPLRLVRGSRTLPEASFQGALYAVCALEGGAALGFRLDRPLDLTIRPALKLPGRMRIGGPLAAEQGILLYEVTPGTYRFTTSERRARKLASAHSSGGGPRRAWLVYGHALWTPGLLAQGLARGTWSEVDPVVLPDP